MADDYSAERVCELVGARVSRREPRARDRRGRSVDGLGVGTQHLIDHLTACSTHAARVGRAAGSTKGFTGRRIMKGAADIIDDGASDDKEKEKPARALNVTTHFLKGDDELALSLKIKLPPTWDDKTVAEAVIKPFVEAYDKKHPDKPASPQGPFTRVKLLVWDGPTKSAADSFRDENREGVEDIKIAEQPIWCLLDVDEPVSALRKRAHNLLKPTVEIELVKAESTALVLRTFPSTAMIAPGDQLIAMLGDTKADKEDMHKLVDAAIAGGELTYLGIATARDRGGRNPLHLAATRGDATLCRKLLRRREDVFAMDSNRDTALHIAAMAGRQIVVKDLLDLGALVHRRTETHAAAEFGGGGGGARQWRGCANVDRARRGHRREVLGCDADYGRGGGWPPLGYRGASELGADVNIRNGYEMMALDYARDQVRTNE